MQLLPFNELLHVDVDGLELVVDNASSPIDPVSFRKKRGHHRRSISAPQGRWGDTVSAPPPLLLNMDTTPGYLHSSIVTNPTSLLRTTSLDSGCARTGQDALPDQILRPPVRRDSNENLLRLTGETKPVPLQKYGSDSLLRIPRRQYSQDNIMDERPSECSRLRLMPSDSSNKNQNGDTLLTLLGHRRNRSSLLDSNESDDQLVLPTTKCPAMGAAVGQRNSYSLAGFQRKLQVNPPSA